MKNLIAIVISAAALVFTASAASAQNGGYWVSMGAPGGKQIRYNNGVYYGPQRSMQHQRPMMIHRGHGVMPPRAILPRTFFSARRGNTGCGGQTFGQSCAVGGGAVIGAAVVGARPTGLPYVRPAVTEVENGIGYTGKSCVRNDGSMGREGFGPDGTTLGCWRH